MSTTSDTAKEYTIDAKGRRIGHVATEAARYLLGKDDPTSVKHLAPDVSVHIVNVRLLDISEKKREDKMFKTYSGYPGGQKLESLGHLAERRGYGEVMRRTIAGMIPKNKLHSVRMKNIHISE